jgi:CheY-like chemotaxis protein
MGKAVLLVEDDPEVRRRLRRSLEEWGRLEIVEAGTVSAALTQLSDKKEIAAAVIDLHLPWGKGAAVKRLIDGNDKPGYVLARKIRAENRDVRVFGVTSHRESFDKDCRKWFCANGDPSEMIGVYEKDLQWVLLRHHILQVSGQETFVRTFVIHGHDHETRDQLRNYAEELGWNVEVLAEMQSHNQTWIERFEKEADQASLAWVLFTPDEWACPFREELDPERRPRPNVLLECGYCLGAFGRLSYRVLLFMKGQVKLPSDLDGVARVHLRGSVADADADIRRELRPWLGPWI